MKTFLQYITELKLNKAVRRLKSKDYDTSLAGFDDVGRATQRQTARAMTASMASEHEKAGAIGSGIDVAHKALLSRAYNRNVARRTMSGEKFAGGIAGKIEDFQKSVSDRKRFNDRMSQQGPDFMPTWMEIDAIHRLDTGKDKPPEHEDSDLHGHILRSQLANAAVGLGGRASDVPAFKPKKNYKL